MSWCQAVRAEPPGRFLNKDIETAEQLKTSWQ